jgi:hypothetical protein
MIDQHPFPEAPYQAVDVREEGPEYGPLEVMPVTEAPYPPGQDCSVQSIEQRGAWKGQHERIRHEKIWFYLDASPKTMPQFGSHSPEVSARERGPTHPDRVNPEHSIFLRQDPHDVPLAGGV